MSDPDPNPGNPSSTEPGRGKPRTTIPVPVRSKQRVPSTVDPQPKKRQKLSTPLETPMSMVKEEVTPGPLPITSEVISNALNSDDSDGNAASAAASAHDTEVNYGHRGESTSHVTIPPGTSTLTLTPNHKAPASPTHRILQPNPTDPPRDPPFRPWTNADDQEHDEYETGHKVPSFLENDRCQTSSRSPDIQIEMGNPETNSWDFWPTRSCQPTPRTRGGRLTNIFSLSMREKSCPACCFTGHVFAIGWVFPSSFLSFFVFLLPLFSGFVSPSTSHLPSANMAHSSTYGRTVPDRSRSRDDPMWHSHHSQQRGRRYDLRPEVPPAPRLRKVLAIVDLQSVRPLMTKTHDDVMDATTCDLLPSLSRVEERALFTFNVLLNTHRLEYFTVYNLLYCISQHIWYTWDHYLPPSSMDIRWQDETGDTFALRNENRLVDLLHDFRPHWIEGQELGILFPNDTRPFTSHLQPYIMRMSCHEALPNRNLLPWDGSKRFHLHSLACFWFPFVLLSLVSFPNVSDLLASFQPLAPAVPWPNVIPCSLASRILHLRWACHVVIHGDLVVMDIPQQQCCTFWPIYFFSQCHWSHSFWCWAIPPTCRIKWSYIPLWILDCRHGHTHPSSCRSPDSNSSKTWRRSLSTPDGIDRNSSSASCILLRRGSNTSSWQFPTGAAPTYGDESGSTRGPSKLAAGVLLQWDHRPHTRWSKPLDWLLGSIHPTCQLLATVFPNSRNTPGWKLASISPWSSGKPSIRTRIRHGWFRLHCRQCWHYSATCPDSTTGNLLLEHSQQWQGCQHGNTRTTRGSRWWLDKTSGPDLLGSRLGSPCQSSGRIYSHIVRSSPSNGGTFRHQRLNLHIEAFWAVGTIRAFRTIPQMTKK